MSKKAQTVDDPITTEVVRGLLDAAAEEVQQVLYKVSHSPLITDGRDSTSALFDAVMYLRFEKQTLDAAPLLVR